MEKLVSQIEKVVCDQHKEITIQGKHFKMIIQFLII
jgi:hypothetical protein